MRGLCLLILAVVLLGPSCEVRSQNFSEPDSILQRDRSASGLDRSTAVDALTPEQRVIALDPVLAMAAIRQLVAEHGEVVALLLILIPQDGSLMPQVLEGQLTGWAAFDPDKADLAPLVEEMAAGIDAERGMVAGSRRRFYEALSQNVEATGAMLPEDQVVAIEAHVEMDPSATNQKRLVIVSKRQMGTEKNFPDQMVTLDQCRIVLTLRESEDSRRFPVSHPDHGDRRVPLLRIVSISY